MAQDRSDWRALAEAYVDDDDDDKNFLIRTNFSIDDVNNKKIKSILFTMTKTQKYYYKLDFVRGFARVLYVFYRFLLR